jgi:monofunctional biosynthetic peptidoglycan transglycosylase
VGRVRNRWRGRFAAWGLALAAAGAVLVAGDASCLFLQVCWLRGHQPATTAFMRIGLERLQARAPGARLAYRWVPYGRISANLKRAVIASEDQRFLEHHGFDVEAIEKAYARNARRGVVRRGGSTISQQLAKNLFLSPRRSYLRKAQEALITVELECLLSKRRILELYLNVVEWGGGIYGAEAASRHYFETPAADLTPEQAARLAAMLPRPRFYTNDPDTPYLDERTEALLEVMQEVRVP